MDKAISETNEFFEAVDRISEQIGAFERFHIQAMFCDDCKHIYEAVIEAKEHLSRGRHLLKVFQLAHAEQGD